MLTKVTAGTQKDQTPSPALRLSESEAYNTKMKLQELLLLRNNNDYESAMA